MSAAPDLASYIQTTCTRIDAALERYLPSVPDCPAIVSESMRYSLFAGGKRLRPVLTMASAETVAAHVGIAATDARELALPAACAIELIHTYSLIHDDLPSMDDDTLRRGRPTAHVVYGEGIAILAGDALLTEALGLLAREPSEAGATTPQEGSPGFSLANRKLRTIALVARAAGACGMVGGQALDLRAAGKAPGHPPSIDADWLRTIHARKTGALLRAAAGAGGIMAGADNPLLDAIDQYASELGLAFQIVDDLLDVEGAADVLGKTAGKDAASGKPTYPALFDIDESRRLARECIERALTTLRDARLEGRLPDIAHWVISRTR